jgi:hypothetical protein
LKTIKKKLNFLYQKLKKVNKGRYSGKIERALDIKKDLPAGRPFNV